LQLICLGSTQAEAAEEAGSSSKAVQRWARRHPAFKERLTRARELRGSSDLDAISELLGPSIVEVPDELEPPPVPPAPPVSIVPARQVVEGEVVEERAKDDELLVPGLPALNERNLLAFYWRTIHDPNAPAGIRSTCIRALHDHTIVRVRQQRSLQLDHAPARTKASGAREKGWSAGVVWGVRRAIVGRPPDKKDDDKVA